MKRVVVRLVISIVILYSAVTCFKAELLYIRSTNVHHEIVSQ